MISLGLIEGRHNLPCQEYLLPADATDQFGFHEGLYREAKHLAAEWVQAHDARGKTVEFYFTGLTVAVLGVVDGLRQEGVLVVLMSFDRENNQYQRIVL